MRIVVDGRSLRHHGDELREAAHHLLGALSALRDDEIHLLVSGDPQLWLPDRVVAHQLGSNGLTRAASVWRRSRALRPDVILGFTPSVEPAPRPWRRRGRVGSHRADATVSMTARLRPELAEQADGIASRPLRILAAPGTALLTLSSSNRTLPGRGVPRLLVVDDAVAERLGREQATWVEVATRLRAALLDTLAMNSWQDRRFKVRPTAAPSSTVIPLPLPLAPAAAERSRARLHRSARWIGGVSAATLTLSAVSAASVNLVLPVHSPPHAVTTPSVVRPDVTSQITTPSVTPTTLAPSSNTATSIAPTVTTTTSGVAPTATPTTGVTSQIQVPGGGPSLTLPSISLPSIQLPTTLPLPQLGCSPSTTTTTASALQLLNPCALPLTGTVLGGL